MTKVMLFGTFDIIHEGHLHMFKEAKEYGDYLIVVVARDKTVCEIKGKNPLNSEDVRLKNISDLNIANKIVLGCIDDKYRIVKEEKPDIVALGYDQLAFVDNLQEALDDHSSVVRLSPYLPNIYKSSKLRGHLKKE